MYYLDDYKPSTDRYGSSDQDDATNSDSNATIPISKSKLTLKLLKKPAGHNTFAFQGRKFI